MAVYNFSIWRPSAILDFKKFVILTAHTLGGPKCVTMPNFVQFGQGVAEIWPFSVFQDGGRPPSWIFKSWQILTARTLRVAKMRHRTNFFADRSRRCRDMAVFDLSRWRRSAIMDFQKLGNFNCPCPSRGQNASWCQILYRSVKALRRYGRF